MTALGGNSAATERSVHFDAWLLHHARIRGARGVEVRLHAPCAQRAADPTTRKPDRDDDRVADGDGVGSAGFTAVLDRDRISGCSFPRQCSSARRLADRSI